MTQLTLLMELLDVIKEILETGATSANIYYARQYMDITFNRFEEHDGMEPSKLDTVLDKIAIHSLDMPPELKVYFKSIESFRPKNEIDPHDFPSGDNSIDVAQLVTDFMVILNELLHAGVTPCTSHEAHVKLDDLFKRFEQQAQAHEEMAGIDDDMPNALNHFFPNIQDDLDGLTLFFI